MKLYAKSRQQARQLSSRLGQRARVVDSQKSPSVNGSRWAVEVVKK